MAKNQLVGNRFAPTGVEIIYYLKKKNLGETSLIEKVISEIKIYNYEPRFLPSLSKITSEDQTWYFFVRKEYRCETKISVKRATPTGFWKVTGPKQKIKNKGVEIGFKRTVYYYEGRGSSGVKTNWKMHEYHITSLPTYQRTYVLCKVMYKGDYQNMLSGGDNSSGSSHSLPEMCPAIVPQPEVEQPIEEVNFNGSSLNQVAMLMNEHVNLPPQGVLGPNTFIDNNNNNNSRNVMWFNDNITLNMQTQTPYSTQDVEMMNWSPGQHSNTTIPFSDTLSRVEQPVEEENFYSFSMNHFAIPVNEHMGLPPWGVSDANTFNDKHNNNNTLSMQPQTPYSTQDVENNWSICNSLFEVEQPLQEENFYNGMYSSLFSDYDYYNPNAELQTPGVAQEDVEVKGELKHV